jgi:hypothetical protein
MHPTTEAKSEDSSMADERDRFDDAVSNRSDDTALEETDAAPIEETIAAPGPGDESARLAAEPETAVSGASEEVADEKVDQASVETAIPVELAKKEEVPD